MSLRKIFILICFLAAISILHGATRDTVDLSGKWQYHLLGASPSIPGEGLIELPNTLDNAHKSIRNSEGDNTTQLRREFSFVGSANYSRTIEIPNGWTNKDIELVIERAKPSTLFIDGKRIGSNSRISAPQRYSVSKYLKPGSHKIEIIVNNADSIPPIVARSSNAVSEASQTNWNGLLGDMFLIAKNTFHINEVNINEKKFPDNLQLNVKFSERAPANLIISTYLNNKEVSILPIKRHTPSLVISLPKEDIQLWSSNNPSLHQLSFLIKNKNDEIIDELILTTGFRTFSSNGKYFTVNGNPVFLRGTVNASVFPLTTYAPLDIDSWLNYFSILKEYGINHVRFHSWTPPDAAFRAADQLGIYILTELPIWGELDRDLVFHNKFLKEELKGIMEEYGHHPSFVLFSPGNELWGDISLMGEYMNEAKFLNPRILSTYGTNVYLGMNGKIGEEDFIISSKTSDKIENSIRGSVSYADSPNGGLFNSLYPNSRFTLSSATKGINIPVISHEVGQYQSYPDYNEIFQYSGNLKPDNLSEFKRRASEAGTLRKSKKFNEASGKWASKLYKAEMELAQRSPGIAGYELFGMQDYTGQGTALVGILNPFMESKGFISPEKWKQSSQDVMLLAKFPKFSFTEGEIVKIPLLTINYSEKEDSISSILWKTDFSHGLVHNTPGFGIMEQEAIYLKLPKVKSPEKATLRLNSNDGKITNSYDFWIFPINSKNINGVTVTNNLTEALILLEQGDKVILCPDSTTVAKASIDPLFITDFWNYRMFRTICDEMNLHPSPGTLGLLINNSHPSLKNFPTENHTDWQWYSIIMNSRPLIIDRLPKEFDPIIEVIDNVERNFRLALMLECKVGKGKLIVLSVDLDKIIQFPEGKWLIQSVKEYMASKEFKPSVSLTPEQLVNLLTKPSNTRLIKELKNETYNSKWD